MEDNNEINQTVEKPKKKNGGLVGAFIIIIVLLLVLIGYLCYDKFLAKKDEPALPKEVEKKPDDSQDDLNTHEDDECVGYKTFTKYEEDNLELYNKCLNQDGYFNIPSYSNDLKIYYHTNEMNVGFFNDSDDKGYYPRGDSFEYDENKYKLVTNKDGDDIQTFGRIYSEIDGDYIYNFLWVYTDVFNAETCVSKDFLIELSKQIYGNEKTFVSKLFSDDDYQHLNNMYCFAGYGFGPGEDFEYYSQNKNGNKWTIKYKNVSGWDTTGKKYATIDFELKDGYWTVQNFKLSDN